MKKEKDVLVLEKGFNPRFIFIILIILVLVGGGYYYYSSFFSNPSYIVKQSLKKFTINNNKNEIDLEKPIRIHGGIEFDLHTEDKEQQKLYETLNNVELLYNIDSDLKNEIINVKLNSKYQNDSLLNAKLYGEKDNIYLFLDDFYDKYIRFKNESGSLVDIKKNSELTEEDLKTIFDGSKKILMDAFVEDDFNREKEEITYNDKKIDVYKNYAVYNKDNYKKINERILKSLKDNKKLTNLLKDKLGLDLFDEYSDDIGDFNGEFIVYTEGYTNKFVKMCITLQDEDMMTKIEVNNNDTISLSMTGNDFDLKIAIQRNDQNNYLTNFDMKIEDVGSINVKVSIIAENIKSVEKIDDKNIVDFDKLSEAEMNKIMEKFSKNKTINKFINDIGEIYNNGLLFSM